MTRRDGVNPSDRRAGFPDFDALARSSPQAHKAHRVPLVREFQDRTYMSTAVMFVRFSQVNVGVRSSGENYGPAVGAEELGPGRYRCGVPRNGNAGIRSSWGLMFWGVAWPWTMKIIRVEKTSSVMTRPLG
jgi:hypothetical protein